MLEANQVVGSIAVGIGFSVGNFLGSGLYALANKVHAITFIKETTSIALTNWTAMMVAVLSSDFDNGKAMGFLFRIAAVFAFTVLSSPIFSKYLSVEQISHIQAAGLTALGMSTTLGMIVTSVLLKEIYEGK